MPPPPPAAAPVPLAPPVPSVPPVPPAPKDRRVLRAVLRWTAAVVVFAAVGAGAAYGVTEQTRGDLPGLATEDDGRWEYPHLVKPPLPAGAPAAFAEENTREEHYADLRGLVLPAPKGARQDKEMAGRDGWLSTAAYLELFAKDARGDLKQSLADGGLRHIAGRGWTMPDGTHTRIYLLQFDTSAFARAHLGDLAAAAAAYQDAPDVEEYLRGAGSGSKVRYTTMRVFDEQAPYGAEHLRVARMQAGDVVGFVVVSGKKGVPRVPFDQTAVLQNQLLG
ncbi:hypothetical protein GTW43_06325 [Streptomyces sp. SID5785]|nr:hypothetical protein [Streptomyces sp. SID5785]